MNQAGKPHAALCAVGVAVSLVSIAASQDSSGRQLSASQLFYQGVQTSSPAAASKKGESLPQHGGFLGIVYRIEEQMGADWVEVAGDTAFHSGGTIHLIVQPNTPRYLYIVTQGSQGEWSVQFPSATLGFDNRVARMQEIIRQFQFQDPVGTERVVVFFSRQPIPDFDKLIYVFSGGEFKRANSPHPPKPKPAIVEGRG